MYVLFLPVANIDNTETKVIIKGYIDIHAEIMIIIDKTTLFTCWAVSALSFIAITAKHVVL